MRNSPKSDSVLVLRRKGAWTVPPTTSIARATPTSCFRSQPIPTPSVISKAIHLLDAGESVVVLRGILGCESVFTTERYLCVRSEQKGKTVEEAYPSLASAEDLNWSEDSGLMSFLRKKCGGGR